AGAKTVKIKRDLQSTGVVAGAKGKTQTIIQGSQGRFRLKAIRLGSNKHFNILVNSVPVGGFTTSGGGSGKARFSTTPGGKDLMMGFEPRGSTVTVQDDDGDDVLDGDIPDDSVDPNAIRCCLSEDSGGGDGDDDQGENQGNGAECEELTADECMTQGGQ